MPLLNYLLLNGVTETCLSYLDSNKKAKCKFFYSASSLQKHLTLYFPGSPVQSNTFSGKHPAMCVQLMCEGCSYIYPPVSIARYSLIQLSELARCRMSRSSSRVELAQGFNTAAQDSNPGFLSGESEALPLSHCALFKYLGKQASMHFIRGVIFIFNYILCSVWHLNIHILWMDWLSLLESDNSN